jgi:hypothetical protein
MNVATQSRPAADRLALLRGGRVYVWMILFSLAVAAFTLTYASTPSYDPWSWLDWGREIIRGGFHVSGGSSWKPLPVIFTTVFSLFGSAAPNLWLLVGRAGALLSVLMTCKLTMRVTFGLVFKNRGVTGFGELSWVDRIAAFAPVVLAGFIAAIGTGLSPGYPANMLLGYSEGLMVGVLLIAFERGWDGHHRQAFALGIVGALDRPEFWLVWAPYGLWLLWKDRQAWPLVVGLAVLMLALWIGPQLAGGGTLKGIITHPENNHGMKSAVNQKSPFKYELHHVILPLVLRRVEIAALLQILLTAGLVVRTRRRGASLMHSLSEHGAAVGGALAGIVGIAWWFGICLETQAGFAGNPRYAVLGTSLIYISGAAGYGWACLGLAQLAGAILVRLKSLGSLLRNPEWDVRVGVGAALMTLVFVFVPGWFAHRLPTLPSIRVTVRYQAEIRERTASLIRQAGGADKVVACGSMMSNNYQVPMVAWYLHVPIGYIQQSSLKLKTGPNVVFQDSSSPGAPLLPSRRQISYWQRSGLDHPTTTRHYRITSDRPVTLYMDCSPPR